MPFFVDVSTALLLAIEEWLTPAGQAIWHKGITPDIEVELPAGASPILPEEEQNMTDARLHAGKDMQLLHALELLSFQSSPGEGHEIAFCPHRRFTKP